MKIQLSMDNVEQQHFAQVGADMRQLTNPLERLGIKHFSRVRIWSDQSISLLTTEPGFSVLFVKEKFYEFAFAGEPEQYSNGIIFLNNRELRCPKIQKIESAFLEHCGLTLDMGIIEVHKTYTDLYWFGTSSDVKNTGNFYLNKVGPLKAFLDSIKADPKNLLSLSEKHRLVYPSLSADKTLLTSPDFQQIINGSNPLGNQHGFTKKEQDCLLLLKQGMSTKEISIAMNRSPRTVEKHLISLKKKTGKKSLLELAVNLDDYC